jgi:phosphoribosylformylglycinamidine cyclo-ligase
MHFNWSATAIGVLPNNLQSDIDGSKIKPCDVVISLKSRGFRSNGFSAVRRILQENFGKEWHRQKYDEHNTWGKKMLTPSLIFAPVINKLIQKNLIPKGIAHITGGGIFDNLKRVLQMTQTGALLDNLFEPLPEMLQLKKLGKVSNDNAYLWWNMGNGMLLVVKPDQAKAIVQEIQQHNYTCQVAGKITENKEISAVFPTFKLTKKL